MKQIFHIVDPSASGASDRLLVRMGETWAAFAYINEQARAVQELGYFAVAEWNKEELTWLQDRMFRPAKKVQIALDNCCALLIPSGVPGSVLNLLADRPEEQTLVQEPVSGWQMNTVFAISPLIQQWINDNFPEAGTIHQLNAMMRLVPSAPAAGIIYLDIRQKDLHLLVAANGGLLLSQYYRYETHEDVIYYLLRACQQFGLSQETMELKLSGLIDKDSALYKEIYQYFLNLELRAPGWKLPSAEVPAHYFTSLNDLYTCVS